MKESLSIQSLSDRSLLERTEFWADEERKATTQLLAHLQEVERRKLYSDLRINSLFKYCIKVLKLSEGSAQRRIQALRLTQDLPQVKEKIESGEISLSVAARMQSFFRQEKGISSEEKNQIAQEVLGKTCFETERVLLRYSAEPEKHLPEKVRPVSASHCRIEFTVSDEEMALFEKVRGLLAHSHPSANWNELFVNMAQKIIEKCDPIQQLSRRSVSPANGLTPKLRRTVSPTKSSTLSPDSFKEAPEKRSPTVSLRREVLRRSDSCCVNCGSKYAPQIDHREDWALGGATTFKNLQTLCRNCNRRKAIRRFGLSRLSSAQQRV